MLCTNLVILSSWSPILELSYIHTKYDEARRHFIHITHCWFHPRKGSPARFKHGLAPTAPVVPGQQAAPWKPLCYYYPIICVSFKIRLQTAQSPGVGCGAIICVWLECLNRVSTDRIGGVRMGDAKKGWINSRLYWSERNVESNADIFIICCSHFSRL